MIFHPIKYNKDIYIINYLFILININLLYIYLFIVFIKMKYHQQNQIIDYYILYKL